MSKILHLSDTHIDRTLMGESRNEDIEAALLEVLGLVKEYQPHLVIHSGDLFQGVRPSTAGMSLATSFLREVSSVAPVVVLTGNHDSSSLLHLFDTLIGGERLRFITKEEVLEFAGEGEERIKVGALPFVHTNEVNRNLIFDTQKERGVAYSSYIKERERWLFSQMQQQRRVEQDVLAFTAHVYLAGALLSGSERGVQVGEFYTARPKDIPRVNYAALGHIHQPQAIPGREVGRFAGSIVPMDFGEAKEKKSVVLVEASPKRKSKVELLEIKSGRKLLQIEGTLDEISRCEVNDEWLKVIVKSEQRVTNLAKVLREKFPRAKVVSVVEQLPWKEGTLLTRNRDKRMEEVGLEDLWEEFLKGEKYEADRILAAGAEFRRLRMKAQKEEEGK